jgi:hypothetical protein
MSVRQNVFRQNVFRQSVFRQSVFRQNRSGHLGISFDVPVYLNVNEIFVAGIFERKLNDNSIYNYDIQLHRTRCPIKNLSSSIINTFMRLVKFILMKFCMAQSTISRLTSYTVLYMLFCYVATMLWIFKCRVTIEYCTVYVMRVYTSRIRFFSIWVWVFKSQGRFMYVFKQGKYQPYSCLYSFLHV